jgi:hypothetical protein
VHRATKAFLKVRQNSGVFINLLVLMLVSGMDELTTQSIGFMQRALFLDVTDEQASLQFANVIKRARKTVKFRKFDNWFHLYSNVKKKNKQAKNE